MCSRCGYDSAASCVPPLADQRGAVVVLGQPAVLHRLPVQLGPRIGRRDRDLDRVRVDLAGEPDRLLDGLPASRPGSPRMNVPCTVIPSSRQSAANRRARSTRRPFLMLLRICWLPDS